MEDHLELRYTLSFSELIHYPDQNSDGYLEKEEFKWIREFLEIDIDVHSWIQECHAILKGEHHLQNITLYYSQNKAHYILLDNYFDPCDQLDTVTIGVKTTSKNNAALKKLGRSFSDSCEILFSYEEGHSAISQFYPIDDWHLLRRAQDPEPDLSKGKLVGKKFTNDPASNVEIVNYDWKQAKKQPGVENLFASKYPLVHRIKQENSNRISTKIQNLFRRFFSP